MESITDEILNKYIDGELSSTELKEFNELISEDHSAIKKLKALQSVDKFLNKLEFDKAPSGITQLIMNKMNISVIETNSGKKFFFSLAIVFSLLTTSILIAAYLFGGADSTTTSNMIKEGLNSFKSIGNGIENLAKNEAIILIGGFISLIFFVTAYFVFEMHRSFRKKIDSFSH